MSANKHDENSAAGTRDNLCATPGCANPRPDRTNWEAVPIELRFDVSARHHFCHKCHKRRDARRGREWRDMVNHMALDAVRKTEKPTRTRKDYRCEVCGAAIPKGTDSWIAAVWIGGNHPSRHRLCPACRHRAVAPVAKAVSADPARPSP